jgi:hypothetical protein
MSNRHITVNDPDDVDQVNPPIYEGPANKAHEKLDEYIYLTNIADRALIVMDSASFLIPIADVDYIPADVDTADEPLCGCGGRHTVCPGK